MRFLLGLLLAAISLPWIAQAEETLTIFIPSGYLPPGLMKEFESRYNCKTVVDLYEEPESMLAKLQGGGPGLYDVLIPTDYTVPALIKQKLLAPLAADRIPNITKLAPEFLKPPFDPENKYTAAFQWGTVGIYARKKAGEPINESWALLFEPAKQPGPIVLLDSMRDTIGAALKFKGHSFNSANAGELKEARDLIVGAVKRSAVFANSPGAKTAILNKTAAVSIVYSSEGIRGMIEDPETVYFIPREGGEYWIDNVAIMATAKHQRLAEQFVNFMLDPEVNAKVSNFAMSSTPIAESRKLIDSKWLNNPAVYPSPERMKKLELLKDLGSSTRLYDQLWTFIKTR